LTTLQIILGISSYFHDSAAALVVDGKIVAAAQEERFNREKNTAQFPINAVRYCLQEADISLHDVHAIVYFEKPFLKFERLLETYYRNAPRGLFSFIKAMPQWAQRKLFVRREIRKALQQIDPSYNVKKQLYFSSHHLSHAASAFYPSPFQKSAILVIDGVGEWSTATIGIGEGSKINLLKEMKFPNSIGLLYSSFTYFLGFEVDRGEYKLMGLSPYGIEDDQQTNDFKNIIQSELIQIFDDGSIKLNRDYFSFEYGLKMINIVQWVALFGINARAKGAPFLQSHCNLALAIQRVIEGIFIKMARDVKELTGCENICLAGGVALNSVANGKLHNSELFKNIWIQPAAGDAGCALGAALAFYYHGNNKRLLPKGNNDGMNNAFLGPRVSDASIESFVESHALDPQVFTNNNERNQFVIQEVLKGKVVGLIQGRMEYGPRALGARSIIANPAEDGMQRHLNLKIKQREDFRPFAPVMLREEAVKYYDCHYPSDYMQYVTPLRPEYRTKPPDDYHELSIKEKLDTPRSHLQAVTHVDYSARLQVVEDALHPLYGLLMEMRRQTGDGILINTSFNGKDEPIVCGLEEAYALFVESNIDILVVEHYVFTKS